MIKHLAIVSFVLFGFSVAAFGQDHGGHVSPYAGQETRKIKSLSAEQIADLLAGRGAGLAKAAELNGVPGPAHILEMKDAINLTPAQEERVRALHARMEGEAKTLGTRLVAAESGLNQTFAAGRMTPETLRTTLAEIAEVESDLRFVHLIAHLETPNVLTPDQIQTYNRLRGYSINPCAAPPPDHDPEMWRRHNGCH